MKKSVANSKASVKISRPQRANVWGPSNIPCHGVVSVLDIGKLRVYF